MGRSALGLLVVFWSFMALARIPALAAQPIEAKTLLERIEFMYSSTDGSMELACKHWIGNEGAGDFDVYCGKGTRFAKSYSVHLVVRELRRPNQTQFEILYWVTDRNNGKPIPGFSSHSQTLTVDGNSRLRGFKMSQGLENDGSQLILTYK